MPKKRAKNTDESKSRTFNNQSNGKNRRKRNSFSTEGLPNPALEAKRKEIEDALQLQRRRRLESVCGSGDESALTNAEGDAADMAHPPKRIHGYYFDMAKNRYFKVDKSKMNPLISLKSTRIMHEKFQYSIDKSRVGLLHKLSNRMMGCKVSASDMASQFLGRDSVVVLDSVAASPSDVFATHPVFGLALCGGPQLMRFVSNVLPSQIRLPAHPRSEVLSLSWNPCITTPIIASIHHTDVVDSIEIYRLNPYDGYISSSPQQILGVLPSKHHKEIFQSMEWAVDGQACYTGGDIGLWKHDLEGRRGRHLILDGISTVTSIQPHYNGCVTMGLRNGNVLQVDEREKSRKGQAMASLMRAIDHICTLKDQNSLICQDITNNILLFDKRVPGVSLHTIRGTSSPSTPRGFSYYEGEAAVRSRKFWISPQMEFLVVSDGKRGDEALVVMDPRRPIESCIEGGYQMNRSILHTMQIQNSTLMSSVTTSVGTTGYWRLSVNGSHDWINQLNPQNMCELSGCNGLSIRGSGGSDFIQSVIMPSAQVASYFRVEDRISHCFL